MKQEHDPWQRMAEAARRTPPPTAPLPQAVEAIPWLPDLQNRVHDLVLRLLWQRWSLIAIAVAAGLLLAVFLASRPAAESLRVDPPATPTIPLPPAP